MSKIELTTYKQMTNSYNLNNIKKDEPSVINFLSYKKYKVTIEEVEEPTDVLIDRLESMLESVEGINRKRMIKREIKRLQQSIE